jgi:hypothetical protein
LGKKSSVLFFFTYLCGGRCGDAAKESKIQPWQTHLSESLQEKNDLVLLKKPYFTQKMPLASSKAKEKIRSVK